jgi:hypothetical protein
LCRNVDLSPPSSLVGDRVIVFVRPLSSGKRSVRVKVGSDRGELDAVALLAAHRWRAAHEAITRSPP